MKSSVSSKLSEHLFGLLEVLPRSLGADIDAALGVAGPAIVHRIEVIVGVHVRNLLNTVVALAIEPVLWLNGRGKNTGAEIIEDCEANKEWNGETLIVKLSDYNESLQRWSKEDR